MLYSALKKYSYPSIYFTLKPQTQVLGAFVFNPLYSDTPKENSEQPSEAILLVNKAILCVI